MILHITIRIANNKAHTKYSPLKQYNLQIHCLPIHFNLILNINDKTDTIDTFICSHLA